MVDIPFTDFAFAATGAPALRATPDRLAEEINAKDWGAPGNGSDQTVAIQAMFNAAIAAGKDVRFPAGDYLINSPINFNQDYDFRLRVYGAGTGGTGNAGTWIHGSVANNALFSRKLVTPHNTYGPRVFSGLKMTNTGSNGGGIRLGSTIGGAVRDCVFTCAGTCISTEDTPGSSSQAINIDTVFLSGSTNVSVGVCHGGSGLIAGADATATDTAFIFYGAGLSVYGTRCERNNWGLKLGVDSGGTERGLKAFSLNGMPMEGNRHFIDFIGLVSGSKFSAVSMTGHDATNAGRGGDEHNTEYGMRIRANKVRACEFVGILTDQWYDIGGIYIEDFTNRAYSTFSGCEPTVGGGAGVPWRLSSNPAGFKFYENSGNDSSQNSPYGTRYTYAQVNDALKMEGDEHDISDGSTATIGNSVTGSGANRVRVRYNGTNWICIGG